MNIKPYIFTLAGLLMILLAGATACACNVPVFRYALERWPADPYRIVVFLDGDADKNAAAAIAILENATGSRTNGANALLQTVDISESVPLQWQKLRDSMKYRELPAVAVQFPAMYGLEIAVWSGALSSENAKSLLDSPARTEIGNRLLDGESAVWIFVESGNEAKDRAKKEFLEESLSVMERELKLPDALEGNEAAMPVDINGGPAVRIDFSVLSISRNDPKEAAFLAMLLMTEPDLADYSEEPMAFPVFGRGRALYALIGEGMTERNIMSACAFMTGACSCEVKSLNPGIDLLMTADWESGIGESWIEDVPLPPLVGITDLTPVGSDTNDGSDEGPTGRADTASLSPETAEPTPESGNLARNIGLSLAAVMLAAVILGFTVGRKNTGGRR